MVAAGDPDARPPKPAKGERWLLDYVATDAGPHDVENLREQRRDVGSVARRLAKLGAIRLWRENIEVDQVAAAPGSPVTLNRDQENALNEIAASPLVIRPVRLSSGGSVRLRGGRGGAAPPALPLIGDCSSPTGTGT